MYLYYEYKIIIKSNLSINNAVVKYLRIMRNESTSNLWKDTISINEFFHIGTILLAVLFRIYSNSNVNQLFFQNSECSPPKKKIMHTRCRLLENFF